MKKLNLLLMFLLILSSGTMLMAQYTHIDLQAVIDAASPGDLITLNTGTYVLGNVVHVNKPNITLTGNNTVFQVSGSGDRIDISANGVTIQQLQIEKTDKTGPQEIIRIRANSVTIKNNIIWGKFVIGDGDVSRAMVFNAGNYTGLQIEGNTIHSLRQPAYISGTNTGNIVNNYIYNTKGWVVEGGNLTFTNNTWGTNVYDIAILNTVPSAYYTNIAEISDANNGAVIEDQRLSPAVLSLVYVDASTAFSSDLGGKYHPYSSIAPAITRVVNGGKIMVASGIYTEGNPQLVINKSLSLIGADKNTTVIKPAQNTGNSGDARAWILVSDGTFFNLKNFTLDGAGKLVNIGIVSRSSGSIENNIFTNIGYNPSGPDYAGRAVAFYEVNMTIRNNILSNIGRIGLYAYGLGVTNAIFTNNTYTGKGVGNWLDYGIELEGGAKATINNNTFSNCLGIATVDGSGSAGILATTYFAPGTSGLVNNNSFNNNTIGIAVGFGTTDLTQIEAHNNMFINTAYGITSTAPSVNAELNYWGTIIESAIQAMVSGPVDYDPWLGKGTAVNFSNSLTVNDAHLTEGLTNLYFGQNSTATDGIDLNLLEEELPPLPPAGVFDSRFILPAGNIGSQRDYRSDTKRFVRWLVKFQGTAPFTFTWDASSLPLGDFYLKDPVDGSLVNINMKNQNTYTLPVNIDLDQLVIENSIYNCYPIDVTEEWNIISLPLSPADPLKSSLFPTSISHAYGFTSNGYYVANELEAKKGYWLNFINDQSIVECGVSLDDEIPVKEGWNMIGILDEAVPNTRISTVPDGIIAGSFFGYNGGYVIVDSLKVGRGYWVRSSADGIIELHNILRKEEYVSPIKPNWASLTISDAQSKKMILYLGEDVDADKFEMPPLPPQGAFDVRFASGKMAERLNEEGLVVNISTTKYPVRIKAAGIDLSVRDLLDGTLLDQSIKAGSELVISDPRVDKIIISGKYASEKAISYNLEQNYPNPFNPSTMIRFSIPDERFVNLSVFNILGEKVTELKNEVMQPGFYNLEFNASSLSSGVYFYTISAGNFVQTKKMLLVK